MLLLAPAAKKRWIGFSYKDLPYRKGTKSINRLDSQLRRQRVGCRRAEEGRSVLQIVVHEAANEMNTRSAAIVEPASTSPQ